MRFWPFSRKPQPPIDRRGTSEDWKAGDLARCVSADWEDPDAHDPSVGDTLRVTYVNDGLNVAGDHLCTFLFFEGKPQCRGWSDFSFVKVRPIEEPASDEFIADLRERLTVPA